MFKGHSQTLERFLACSSWASPYNPLELSMSSCYGLHHFQRAWWWTLEVNANGETYPVGFFISNWPACFAANIVGATLVEEVLGYHTMVNFENPGGGTVAAYYGVTGCRTPDDAADRGCLQGVTCFRCRARVEAEADWRILSIDKIG